MLIMAENLGRKQSAEAEQCRKQQIDDVEVSQFPHLRDSRSAKEEGRRSVTLSVEGGKLSALKDVCKSLKVTLDTLYKTAWALVLGRYATVESVSFYSIKSLSEGDEVTASLCSIQLDDAHSFVNIAKTIEADTVRSLPYQEYSLADVRKLLINARKPKLNNLMVTSGVTDDLFGELNPELIADVSESSSLSKA
jgi:predicted DNA binding CopG/RHH family protein